MQQDGYITYGIIDKNAMSQKIKMNNEVKIFI